jgi:hypothetical protein
MTGAICSSLDKEKARLAELFLGHLAIPRPGRSRHMHEFQDNLLPAFMKTARYARLASTASSFLSACFSARNRA